MKTLGRWSLAVLSLVLLASAPLGAARAQVQVTSADPSSTIQGTVSLDVAVTGNGFNSTASVQFLVTGTTDPGGVVVKKVDVSSSKKLIATIDVSDTAVVNKFDIVVALSDGRKGKGTTLFAVQAKGKPTPPPPPPPLPAMTCAGSPGVFPAFAYLKDKYITVKKGGGTRIYDGSDLYIANSTGSCSIPIYIGTSSSSPFSRQVSYRQIGTEARIAWAQGSEVRLLKFQVVNGSVVETRPIPPSIVYALNGTSTAIGSVDLSRDGQTLYYADEILTVDGRWIDSVNLIGIATCSSNCSPQRIYTFEDDIGPGGVTINDSDDRLFMAIHYRVPDIRTVSFLEKQGGSWASPLLRHVVSNQDAAYATVSGLAAPAVGKWDYNHSSILSEVVAFVVERPSGDTTTIIDVSNCSASGVSSCFSSGESSVVRSGIAGSNSSFTSMPSSLSDVGPNLLVEGNGWISDLDLDVPGATPIPFLQGVFADSAD